GSEKSGSQGRPVFPWTGAPKGSRRRRSEKVYTSQHAVQEPELRILRVPGPRPRCRPAARICSPRGKRSVRLDMALPDALPFAGKPMRSIGCGECARLGKQLDCRNELLDIFAAVLLSPEIVA